MALSQSGLEFIHDTASAPELLNRDEHIIRRLNQGDSVLRMTSRAGARVCMFVMSPGPEANLVVISQPSQPELGLDGTVYSANWHIERPASDYPHNHSFDFVGSGRPLDEHDAVTALAHLAQLSAGLEGPSQKS